MPTIDEEYLETHPFGSSGVEGRPASYVYKAELTGLTGQANELGLEDVDTTTRSLESIVLTTFNNKQEWILVEGPADPTNPKLEVAPLDYDPLINDKHWALLEFVNSSGFAKSESGAYSLSSGQLEGTVNFLYAKTVPGSDLRFNRLYILDPDSPAQAIQIVIRDLTSTGFTFALSASPDSDNSVLYWSVGLKHNETPVAITPTGGAAFNILAYGATQDGTTDQTAAIQAAIDAAILVTGDVFIPPSPNRYQVSTLNIYGGCRITGSDASANGTILESTTNAPLFNITARCTIQNLTLIGSGNIAHTAQDLILVNATSDVILRDLTLLYGYNLLRFLNTCWQCSVTGVRFLDSRNTAVICNTSGTPSAAGQEIQFNHCLFSGGTLQTNYVGHFYNVGSLIFNHCVVTHSNTGHGGFVFETAASKYGGIRFIGCDVELENELGHGPALALIGTDVDPFHSFFSIGSYYGAGNNSGERAIELHYVYQSAFIGGAVTAPQRGIYLLKKVHDVQFIGFHFMTSDLPVVSDGELGTALLDELVFSGCYYHGPYQFLTLSPATVGNLVVRDSKIGNIASVVAEPAWSTRKRVIFDNCWIGDGANNYTLYERHPWTAPTLHAGWSNVGGANQVIGYYKDNNGFVHLRGLASGSPTTIGTVLFTLPLGFRPEFTEYAAKDVNGNTTAVGPDGTVFLNAAATGAVSLANITFHADH